MSAPCKANVWHRGICSHVADCSSGGNGSKAPGRKSYEGPGLIEKLGNDDPQPLRLIIVGHNPSEVGWHTVHQFLLVFCDNGQGGHRWCEYSPVVSCLSLPLAEHLCVL